MPLSQARCSGVKGADSGMTGAVGMGYWLEVIG